MEPDRFRDYMEAGCIDTTVGLAIATRPDCLPDVVLDYLAELAREHNDANVIAIGARQHTVAEAIGFIDRFIATPFSGDERHVRRIAQLAR